MGLSFDIGGFLGGIFGAWGAYGAARRTIRWEREKEAPKLYSKAYSTACDMQLKIADLYVSLKTLPEGTVFDVVNAIQKFSKAFGPIMSDAIESDERLAQIGFFLYTSMDKALEKPCASGDPREWKKPETKSEARAIVTELDEVIGKALKDTRDILDGIRSKYQKQNRFNWHNLGMIFRIGKQEDKQNGFGPHPDG